jgi:3-oxoadipate enol-lactonase
MADNDPLALLIPGLDGTGLLYYRQVEALSRRYRVRPWRFAARAVFDYADLVQELGDGTQAEARHSVLVVGESFGGVLALHYALAFPERVRRLILLNTFPYYRRRLRARLAELLAPVLAWGASRKLKDRIVAAILEREGIGREDINRYHAIVRQVDMQAYRRRLALVRQVDLRPRLGEIRAPTVILVSGRDKLVPSTLEAQVLSSGIPHAVVHEFPRAGHALVLTPGFSLADYAEEGILKRSPNHIKEMRDESEAGKV